MVNTERKVRSSKEAREKHITLISNQIQILAEQGRSFSKYKNSRDKNDQNCTELIQGKKFTNESGLEASSYHKDFRRWDENDVYDLVTISNWRTLSVEGVEVFSASAELFNGAYEPLTNIEEKPFKTAIYVAGAWEQELARLTKPPETPDTP